jgi:hypothetical protein
MFSKIVKYVFQAVLLALPFLLPQIPLRDDSGVFLTAVSLLFAILVGFFIATTTSNYLRLQTLIADANAGLISIYNLVKHIEPNKAPIVEEAIDEYMIASLDYELLDYTDKTKKEFNRVMDISASVEPIGEKGLALFSELHARMDDLLTNDQEIALTSKKIVSPRHWFVIFLLAILLATSLLSFRNGSFLISIFVGIMFIAIYHIMILIHEIDINMFLSSQLSFEDPQQVFHGIGRDDYYPEYAIKKGYVKPKSGAYRIGIYKDRARSLEKEIKLIEPQ